MSVVMSYESGKRGTWGSSDPTEGGVVLLPGVHGCEVWGKGRDLRGVTQKLRVMSQVTHQGGWPQPPTPGITGLHLLHPVHRQGPETLACQPGTGRSGSGRRGREASTLAWPLWGKPGAQLTPLGQGKAVTSP